MAGYYQCEGLVIKTIPYRESDEWVTFLAPDLGKIRALARGVKKPKSSLRAPLQPFCQSRLYLAKGRELDTITQASIIDFFPLLRDDFKLSLAALYITELLDKGLAEQEPAPKIYRLTLEVLRQLAAGENIDLWLRYFEINLLADLGYYPELQHCTRCQGLENLTLFNPAAGGMVCSNCGELEMTSGQRITGETLGILRRILGSESQVCRRLKVSAAASRELEKVLAAHWHYHLEQPLYYRSIYRQYQEK